MKDQLVHRFIQLGILFLGLLIVALVYSMFAELAGLWVKFGRILLPFFIAIFITYLLHPAVDWLDRKGICRPYSILLIFGLFLAGFSLVILKATPYLIEEGKDFIEQLPMIADTYRGWMGTFHAQTEWLPDSFQAKVDMWLERGEAYIADAFIRLVEFLKTILDLIFLVIAIPFIVFYLLKDINLINKVVWYFTPSRWRSGGRLLLSEVDESLGNYIRGQIIVCVAIGIFAFIGFWLIELPYASLIAVFFGVTNVIPYFGPIVGSIPVLLIALTEGTNVFVLALSIIFILQFLEGNIFAPLIVGKSLHMHPVLIIFALVVGGELAGIIGLIFAVPLLAILKVFIIHFRKLIRDKKAVIER
ncbi:AI-2E family transporter [Alteribacter populi]|uniref:AI-2E family transporter n=1 Tax=Alteribacter populi TaxID=2011011 RepID=UPI000BBACE65|nr:AI-2E family transporter [Alteribacter populi]